MLRFLLFALFSRRLKRIRRRAFAAAHSPPRIRRRAFTRLFERVQRGELQPDAAGIIHLDTDARLTGDGNIYVTSYHDLLMVLFPLWRGKGSNLQGVLLSSRALNLSDTRPDCDSRSQQAIKIFAPGCWSPTPTSWDYIPPHHRQTEVVIEKELWSLSYWVSYGLD